MSGGESFRVVTTYFLYSNSTFNFISNFRVLETQLYTDWLLTHAYLCIEEEYIPLFKSQMLAHTMNFNNNGPFTKLERYVNSV
jgi:hypothetical protein